jgi:serine/threonine-protein kinase
MKVGATAQAQFMSTLFGEKIAAQQEALRAGRQLAEIIAAQEEEERSNPTGRTGEFLMLSDADLEEMGTPSTMAASPIAKGDASRGRDTRAWMVEKQKSGSRRLVIGATAVLLVCVAIGGTLAYSQYGRTDPSPPVRPTGTIEVTSNPAGAAIKLNGELTAWRTPHHLTKLPLGATYDLRLVLDGYEPFVQAIALTETKNREVVQATLRRQSAASLAVVKVATSPPGATLILDGADTNLKSPATIAGVQPGIEHVLLVQLAGYQDKQVPITLTASQVAELSLTLDRAPLGEDESLLVLTTEPADATLQVGSETYSSGSPYEVRIAAGRKVSISVSRSGYDTQRRDVEGRPRQNVEVSVTLERERRITKQGGGGGGGGGGAPGTLVLDSRPWCNVTIDGVPRGQTPIVNLSLPSGRHSGRCVNPQFGINASFVVNIEPGQTTRKRLTHDTQ